MSDQGTPFIPPISSPPGNSPIRPPVVPSPNTASAAPLPEWYAQAQNPGAYPQFYPGTGAGVGSPYGGTPFIPTMYTPAMGGGGSVQPTSYFPPPVALPGAGGGGGYPSTPAGPPQGFAPDFIGYGAAAAAANAPWPNAPQGTPWAPPGTGFVGVQQLPGGGALGINMMPPGMGMQMGWGGAPQAMYTPYPAMAATPAWGQAPMPGMPGAYMMQPQAAPPPPPQPARDPEPAIHFVEERNNPRDGSSNISRFATGRNYGPVLTPFLTKIVKANIQVNPLIGVREDSTKEYIKWNMLFPSNYCQSSAEPAHQSWMGGRGAPATFPRLQTLRIISRTFPWMIMLDASDPEIGLTCGEVMDKIGDFLQSIVKKSEHNQQPSNKQREVIKSYHHNRSPAYGVPGGRAGRELRKFDYLGRESMFGGIRREDGYVKEFCGGEIMPCTLVLVCEPSYPMTQQEIDDHAALEARQAEERAQEVERERERPRSGHRSRPSSANRPRTPHVRPPTPDSDSSM
ncbi:hypothetical protein JAAARDRAFT_46386 [Jaapia argillacea MUCL 33604]|uniref:DUF6699 domain-containing protein n=1 Tax=Jaapia argillacea MUCL 33604 TaxID=933084 RepID=A0A067QAY1_9AGAM|nr:hypothetical protein JAAARDRAFT_46386 [Jaapia argillacea MUCL 33604]